MIKIVAINLTLKVSDLDKSIKFYVDVLGFNLLKKYSDHYAQIEASGLIIGLHPTINPVTTSNDASIGFTVTDFDDAKKSLAAYAIVYIERDEKGGNFIHFTDPDGYSLYVIKTNKN